MAAVADDSFCAIADVEGRWQRGAFGASTNPSDQEVLEFMAQRAGQITARLRKAGIAYTVPSGDSPIPATGDGPHLSFLCALANSKAAAADAMLSMEVLDEDEITPVAKSLLDSYGATLDDIEILGKNVAETLGTSSSTRDHIGTGGIGAEDFSGSEVTRSFGLDTKW